MRWCQEHWDGLRAEIHKQGADALVSDSGAEVAEKLKMQLEGDESLASFDPLMNASWAINGFIASHIGEGGFIMVLAYEGCPICKYDEDHKAICPEDECTYSVADYFPNAVADQVALFKELASGESNL